MNLKFELTYFALSSKKPVNLYFSNIDDVYNWFDKKVSEFKGKECVYLFTSTNEHIQPLELSEVFVTERFGLIADLLKMNYFFGLDLMDTFHLHEYESFEDAYSVAFNMKEGNELCFNK